MKKIPRKKLPPALPPEELSKFVQEESDRISHLELIALSLDRSHPERRDAIAEIKGICLRLGSMLLRSPEQKAEGTAAARTESASKHEPREKIMQEAIAKYPPGYRGLAKLVAKELRVNPKTVRRHLRKKRTR